MTIPPTLLFVLIVSAALSVHAEDIFAPTQGATTPNPLSFEDAQAFFTATKDGRITEKLVSGNDLDHAAAKPIGNSIKAILIKDYGVKPDRIRPGVGTDTTLAYALRWLTLYENAPEDSAAEKERLKSLFQKQIDEVFGREGDRYNPYYGDSRAAFVRFAKDYTSALNDHKLAEVRSQQERRLVDADQKRRAQEEERKVQEQLRLEKEAVDAKLASQAEADKIRLDAESEALAQQAKEKQEKLEAVLQSEEYGLWKQSLRVTQALQMIEEARGVLALDTAVAAKSGVSNLIDRRQAGEKMVAGEELLKNAFAAYKELGGPAATPGEVELGPDPAEPYR